jgi:tetratricopeptide (TPR) repeat protein
MPPGFFQRLFASPRSVADEVLAALTAGSAEPFAALDKLSGRSRLDALDDAARALQLDLRFDDAWRVAEHAASLDPEALLERRSTLARLRGDIGAELDLAERAVAREPRSVSPREAHVRLLLDADRVDEALAALDTSPVRAPELEVLRAAAWLQADRLDEAEDAAERLLATLAGRGGDVVLTADAAGNDDVVRAARGIVDTVRLLRAGNEQRLLGWRRRGLGPEHTDANFTLIGLALLERGPEGDDAELAPLDLAAALEAARIADEDPIAVSAAATACLRAGDFDRAERLYTAARALAPDWYAPALGLGTTRRRRRFGLGLDVLPELPEHEPALDAVLPDRAALTADERRVLSASLSPLLLWAESPPPFRVLPLESPLAPDGPHVRVDEVLDTTSHAGWSAAWQAARAWFPALATERRAAWAAVMRPDDDPAAGFADAYEDWLRARYLRPRLRLDPEGDAGLPASETHFFSPLATG